MLTRSDLASACRRLDATIADGFPLERIFDHHGVDPRAVDYVAEWRALRIALIYDGWSESEVNALSEELRPQRMRLSPASDFWMPAFAAVYREGFATGLILVEERTSPPGS